MTDVLAPSTVGTTRDLTIFCAHQPSGNRVLLPLSSRYKFNGSLVVPATITVQSQATANNAFDGHAVIHRDQGYGWRIVPDLRATVNGQPNPAYNPLGRSSQWQYDVQGGYTAEPASLKNPHAVRRADGTYSTGAEWGGYDATTQVDSAGNLHLVALYGAPWVGVPSGQIIQWLVASGTMGYQQLILGSQASVAADGKSINLGPAAGQPHVDTGGTVAWCVTTRGGGWAFKFVGDDTVPLTYCAPIANKPWSGYLNALQRIPSQDPTAHVLPGGKLIGVEVVGANPRRDLAIPNYDKSDPIVNEFEHNIYVEQGGQVILCDTHHAWGDGISGPGDDIWNTSHHNGREGTPAMYNNKLIAGSRYWANHHSDIDIEGARVSNVKITATLGGTGIAISTPVDNLTLDLTSTNAQVAAGLIPVTSSLVRGSHWGGGGSNWNVKVNTDYVADKVHIGAPALMITGGVVGLDVHDSHKATNGYFLQTDTPNPTVTDCDGGPGCLGAVAP